MLGWEVQQPNRKRKLLSRMLWCAHYFRLLKKSFILCACVNCMQEFIQTKGYPSWTNVTCVREGAETPLFKQNFVNWVTKGETTSLVKTQKKIAGEQLTQHNNFRCFLFLHV